MYIAPSALGTRLEVFEDHIIVAVKVQFQKPLTACIEHVFKL